MTGVVLGASAPPLYNIPLKDIDGKSTSLKAYAGQVLLIVNVASKCGYTPQYKGLEALHEKYKGQGFEVLGFPCNDFGAQEPGSNADIKTFCTSQYQVTFPMFDKLHVLGPDQHPLYAALDRERFLCTRAGEVELWEVPRWPGWEVIARFDSKVTPESPELNQAIQAALAKK